MYEKISNDLRFIEGGYVYCINGATGFIGASIIRFLLWMNENKLKKKNKIVAVTRNREKAVELYSYYPDEKNLIIYQIDNHQMPELNEDIDFVIHTAGPSMKSVFVEKPVETCDDIYLEASNILNWANRQKIKSIVFLSSVQVYGNLSSNGVPIQEERFGTLDSMNAGAVYAEGKRMSEMLCSSYYKEYELPVKVVRLYSVYGSGMQLKSGTFLTDFLMEACMEQKIIINGSGREIRNLCHIEDIISGILHVLHNGKNGDAYNLGSENNNLSILETANIIKGDGKVVLMNEPDLRGENKIYDQIPDLSKIKVLGWKENCSDFMGNITELILNIKKK